MWAYLPLGTSKVYPTTRHIATKYDKVLSRRSVSAPELFLRCLVLGIGLSIRMCLSSIV